MTESAKFVNHSGTSPEIGFTQLAPFPKERVHLQALRISKERLPTNTTSDCHPIHRWFNFIAGFSPEFVHQSCASFDGPSVLLDPFGGCGTAPLVAKQRGMDSISFDPHPIFARIANAKVNPGALVDVDEIEDLISSVFEGNFSHEPTLSNEAKEFLSKLFSPEVLESLLKARSALLNSKFRGNDLAFLMLSRVVEMTTNAQTDGIYKAPTSKRRASPPLVACTTLANIIRDDLVEFVTPRADSIHRVFRQSSTTMTNIAENSVDIVVTSPPYLNNFDFAEMTRMLLYFWGVATSWGDITSKVRSKLIVNTTTALKGHKEKQSQYCESLFPELRKALAPLVEELAVLRTQKAGKKEYDFLIYPYFSQMREVLQECHRCLKPGKPAHIMVADAALYGVHISTPQFLAEIMEHIGFRGVHCEFVRRRGHRWILSKRAGSQIGLGEYHVFGTK